MSVSSIYLDYTSKLKLIYYLCYVVGVFSDIPCDLLVPLTTKKHACSNFFSIYIGYTFVFIWFLNHTFTNEVICFSFVIITPGSIPLRIIDTD